ncbi:hypothetical protein B0H17DRAFT_1093024 [Mycena rosella]|uniref:F-box domain-containing protein n=1 Tax=Mycena rosella TaxID=1033263 RepID=A0AAD7CX97_MYCRO|nr:hypothetical protein B0H17DRAFT_1093024 [Mycena rosella]
MLHSSFESILHTNVVPSDADCQRICDLLVGPRKEAADLSAEISRMKKLLDELTEKRDALDNFIAAHSALISPARRLPEDIVRDIFVACLPSNRNALILSDEAPLLLCQICSAWRQLALLTPRLWASVHIVVPNPPVLNVLAEMVTHWLNRSGALPLSISVVFSRTWKIGQTNLPLLMPLIGFSRRWQDIELTVNHVTCTALETLSPDDVPLLKSINIRGIQRRIPGGVGIFHDGIDNVESLAFLNTASLRSVTVAQGSDLHKFPLPWAQLRGLVVENEGIQYAHAVDILRQCLFLEHCVLQISPSLPPPDQRRIPLPHLRHLSISVGPVRVGTPNAVAFFNLIVAPNLRSLAYSQLSSVLGPFPFASLLAKGSLECFSLSLSDLPHNTVWADCLAAMPLVHKFRLAINGRPHLIGRGSPHEDVVTQLTPSLDGSRPILCPLLQSIELTGLNETVSDQALLRLVQARTGARPRGVTQLSRVTFAFQRDMEVDILPSLEQEISLGLVVSLQYKHLFKDSYSAAQGTEREIVP